MASVLTKRTTEQFRATELKWRGHPPGMSSEMADDFMARLNAGSTVKKLTSGGETGIVSYLRFKKHCTLNAEWAAEAMRRSRKNGSKGKGARRRNLTHCRYGHTLADARVSWYRGYIKRDCATCRKLYSHIGAHIEPHIIEQIRSAFDNGATVNQVTTGTPLGGGQKSRSLKLVDSAAFYRYRRENSEFNQFIIRSIAKSSRVARSIGWDRKKTRIRNEVRRTEANDYYKILAMLPAGFPDKDDVVSAIFEDLLSGKLERDEVSGRVKVYVTAHNRMFPTKFAKFGDSMLVSLDEVLFEGTATRGDTVSGGLWD